MSEEPKRRVVPRWLLLPLIVTVLLAVVVHLAARGRASMISRLSDVVACGATEEATAAVRTLARMARPPVAVLVDAAASPCGEISAEAQFAIGGVLRQIQRDIDEDRRTKVASRQLGALVESLAEKQKSFAAQDFPWLGRTTRRVVRLANQLPSDSMPMVAAHCDAILAEIGKSEVARTAFVAAEPPDDVPPLADVTIPATPMSATVESDSAQARMRQRFASLTEQPYPSTASVSSESMAWDSAGESENDRSATPFADLREAGSAESNPVPVADSASRLKWMHPMFFITPAVPINAVPPVDLPLPSGADPLPTAVEEPPPDRQDRDDVPLASLDARELLARWLVAKGAELYPLEEELTRRGFGRLSETLVDAFFSEFVEDRLRLVEDVLTEPGIDARPWLILLADDSSADVRLLAVTIMATSNDPEMIEKAWQVAIRDHDPRIARLVERLRERRRTPQAY